MKTKQIFSLFHLSLQLVQPEFPCTAQLSHLIPPRNHGNWTGEYPDTETKLGWPDYFESLLLKYDVDLVLAGHVHHYERSWPVWERNNTVQSYDDVTKPIHVTCGHAGKGLYK